MMISWVTYERTKTSTVQYGTSTSALDSTATGDSTHYYLPLYESPSLHSAKLTGLKENTRYYYKVGDPSGGWSNVFYFDTEDLSPVTPENPLNIAIIADHGATANSQQVVDAMGQLDKERQLNC
jgi:hypothetical protein